MSTVKKTILRSVAIFLVAAFSVNEFAWAAPVISPLVIAASMPKASELRVSADFAKIGESYEGHEPRLLIHIQDAHSNLGAQQNIAKTLDELITRYKIQTFFVEGGTQDDSLNFLRPLATRPIRERVAKKYLMKGELSGAEYLNLSSDHDMRLLGVEDASLYDKNLLAYAAVAKDRQKVLDFLDEIEKRADSLKRQMYPATLVALDDFLKKFHKKDKNFTEYYSVIASAAAQSGVNLLGYPEFLSLKTLKDEEAQIDFKKANEEQAAHQNGAEFEKYSRYLEHYSHLNIEHLLSETRLLEGEIFRRGLPEHDTLYLYEISGRLKTLKTLFSLQASKEDFETYLQYQKNDAFHTLVICAFLNRKLLDVGRDADVVAYTGDLEQDKKNVEEFYRLTLQRDEVFVQKALDKMSAENIRAAALITGGYHTQNLKRLLQKRGVSYAIITPLVAKETNTKRYEEILLGQLGKKNPLAKDKVVDGSAKADKLGVRMAFERPLSPLSAIREELLVSAITDKTADRGPQTGDRGAKGTGVLAPKISGARLAQPTEPESLAGRNGARHLAGSRMSVSDKKMAASEPGTGRSWRPLVLGVAAAATAGWFIYYLIKESGNSRRRKAMNEATKPYIEGFTLNGGTVSVGFARPDELEEVLATQQNSPSNPDIFLSRGTYKVLIANHQVVVARGAVREDGKTEARERVVGAVAIHSSKRGKVRAHARATNPAFHDLAGDALYDTWIVVDKRFNVVDRVRISDALLDHTKAIADSSGKALIAFSRPGDAYGKLSETEREHLDRLKRLIAVLTSTGMTWFFKKLITRMEKIYRGKLLARHILFMRKVQDKKDPGSTQPFMDWVAKTYGSGPLHNDLKSIIDPDLIGTDWNPANDKNFIRLEGLLVRKFLNEHPDMTPVDPALGLTHSRKGAAMENIYLDGRPDDWRALGANVMMSYERIADIDASIARLIRINGYRVLTKDEGGGGARLANGAYEKFTQAYFEPKKLHWKHQEFSMGAQIWYDEDFDVFIVKPDEKTWAYYPQLHIFNTQASQEAIGPTGSFGQMSVRLTTIDGKTAALIDEVHPSLGYRRLRNSRLRAASRYWVENAVGMLMNDLKSLGVQDFYASTPGRIRDRYLSRFNMTIPAINLWENYQFAFSKKGWELVHKDLGDEKQAELWKLTSGARLSKNPFEPDPDKREISSMRVRTDRYPGRFVKAVQNELNQGRSVVVKDYPGKIVKIEPATEVSEFNLAGRPYWHFDIIDRIIPVDLYRERLKQWTDQKPAAGARFAHGTSPKQIIAGTTGEWRLRSQAPEVFGSRLAAEVVGVKQKGVFEPSGKPIILLVEDDENFRSWYLETISNWIASNGFGEYQFVLAEDLPSAKAALHIGIESRLLKLVITDKSFPHVPSLMDPGYTDFKKWSDSGIEVFNLSKQAGIPVFMQTGGRDLPSSIPADSIFRKGLIPEDTVIPFEKLRLVLGAPASPGQQAGARLARNSSQPKSEKTLKGVLEKLEKLVSDEALSPEQIGELPGKIRKVLEQPGLRPEDLDVLTEVFNNTAASIYWMNLAGKAGDPMMKRAIDLFNQQVGALRIIIESGDAENLSSYRVATNMLLVKKSKTVEQYQAISTTRPTNQQATPDGTFAYLQKTFPKKQFPGLVSIDDFSDGKARSMSMVRVVALKIAVHLLKLQGSLVLSLDSDGQMKFFSKQKIISELSNLIQRTSSTLSEKKINGIVDQMKEAYAPALKLCGIDPQRAPVSFDYSSFKGGLSRSQNWARASVAIKNFIESHQDSNHPVYIKLAFPNAQNPLKKTVKLFRTPNDSHDTLQQVMSFFEQYQNGYEVRFTLNEHKRPVDLVIEVWRSQKRSGLPRPQAGARLAGKATRDERIEAIAKLLEEERGNLYAGKPYTVNSVALAKNLHMRVALFREYVGQDPSLITLRNNLLDAHIIHVAINIAKEFRNSKRDYKAPFNLEQALGIHLTELAGREEKNPDVMEKIQDLERARYETAGAVARPVVEAFMKAFLDGTLKGINEQKIIKEIGFGQDFFRRVRENVPDVGKLVSNLLSTRSRTLLAGQAIQKEIDSGVLTKATRRLWVSRADISEPTLNNFLRDDADVQKLGAAILNDQFSDLDIKIVRGTEAKPGNLRALADRLGVDPARVYERRYINTLLRDRTQFIVGQNPRRVRKILKMTIQRLMELNLRPISLSRVVSLSGLYWQALKPLKKKGRRNKLKKLFDEAVQGNIKARSYLSKREKEHSFYSQLFIEILRNEITLQNLLRGIDQSGTTVSQFRVYSVVRPNGEKMDDFWDIRRVDIYLDNGRVVPVTLKATDDTRLGRKRIENERQVREPISKKEPGLFPDVYANGEVFQSSTHYVYELSEWIPREKSSIRGFEIRDDVLLAEKLMRFWLASSDDANERFLPSMDDPNFYVFTRGHDGKTKLNLTHYHETEKISDRQEMIGVVQDLLQNSAAVQVAQNKVFGPQAAQNGQTLDPEPSVSSFRVNGSTKKELMRRVLDALRKGAVWAYDGEKEFKLRVRGVFLSPIGNNMKVLDFEQLKKVRFIPIGEYLEFLNTHRNKMQANKVVVEFRLNGDAQTELGLVKAVDLTEEEPLLRVVHISQNGNGFKKLADSYIPLYKVMKLRVQRYGLWPERTPGQFLSQNVKVLLQSENRIRSPRAIAQILRASLHDVRSAMKEIAIPSGGKQSMREPVATEIVSAPAKDRNDIESMGGRLATALKVRATTLIPVLFASAIYIFNLTPTDASATEIKISQAVDYSNPGSGPVLSSQIVQRNQRPAVAQDTPITRDTDVLQEARGIEFIKNQTVLETIPANFLEADFPTATAVPTSIFDGLSDAAFRAQAGDLVRGAYQFHQEKYGKNSLVYFTGTEKLDGARLAILQALVAPYSFMVLGEAKEGTSTLRFVDVDDVEAAGAPLWQFSYPISRVLENDLMGWFGKLAFSRAISASLNKSGKSKPESIQAADIPSALLDAQAIVSAKRADAKVFSDMLSNRVHDLKILAQYKLIKYSELLGSAIAVLEKLKRSVLSAA